MNSTRLSVWAVVAISGIAATNASGATITQTYSGAFPATIMGTLPDQGSVLLQNFTLSTANNLTVTTTSYAAGGFQPNLLLFNSMGNFMTAGIPFGAVDPSTGIVGDMRLMRSNLAAGGYTIALVDFLLNQSLTATGLSDGFTVNFGSGTTFVDSNGNQRTGNFAFTIAAAATGSGADIPEPSTIWLSIAPLAALAILAKRRSGNKNFVGETK